MTTEQLQDAPTLADTAAEVTEQENTAVENENTSDAGEVEVNTADEGQGETDSAESDSDNDGEDTDDEATKTKKHGFEKRVSKLNQRIAEREKEIEYWRREALKHQPVQEQAQPVQEQANVKKPQLEDYSTMVEYTEALTDWKIEQRLQREQHQTEQQAVITTYTNRIAEFEKVHPDFQEVVAEAGDIPMAPEIHSACLESENGPAIVYHLAQNPEIIERLNGLSPYKRLVEMAKLESKIANQPTKPSPNHTKTVVKTVKSAPTPVNTVNGPGVVAEKSIYEMTPAELIAHRNKTDRARRR